MARRDVTAIKLHVGLKIRRRYSEQTSQPCQWQTSQDAADDSITYKHGTPDHRGLFPCMSAVVLQHCYYCLGMSLFKRIETYMFV